MYLYAVDTAESLRALPAGTDEVLLCSHIRDFGGGSTPSLTLVQQALAARYSKLWLLLREEPFRPQDVNWERDVAMAVTAAKSAVASLGNASLEFICPVPMTEDYRLAPISQQQSESLQANIWADPSVFLLRRDEWGMLKRHYKGVVYPLVGFTDSEVQAAAENVRELCMQNDLELVVVPYKVPTLSDCVMQQIPGIRVVKRTPKATPETKGVLMPFQEHELVANIFSLPLNET